MNLRQNTKFRGIIAEEDSKRKKIVLTRSLRIQKQWPGRLISKAFPVKVKYCKLDLGSLGRLFQNQPKDWGLVGDGYPPGPPEGQDASRGARGPNNPQGHPFVGLGRND